MNRMKFKHEIREHLLEFFLVGGLLNIAENVSAIMIYGRAAFNWNMVLVATLTAIPFAIISELVVDRTEIFRLKRKKKKGNKQKRR